MKTMKKTISLLVHIPLIILVSYLAESIPALKYVDYVLFITGSLTALFMILETIREFKYKSKLDKIEYNNSVELKNKRHANEMEKLEMTLEKEKINEVNSNNV